MLARWVAITVFLIGTTFASSETISNTSLHVVLRNPNHTSSFVPWENVAGWVFEAGLTTDCIDGDSLFYAFQQFLHFQPQLPTCATWNIPENSIYCAYQQQQEGISVSQCYFMTGAFPDYSQLHPLSIECQNADERGIYLHEGQCRLKYRLEYPSTIALCYFIVSNGLKLAMLVCAIIGSTELASSFGLTRRHLCNACYAAVFSCLAVTAVLIDCYKTFGLQSPGLVSTLLGLVYLVMLGASYAYLHRFHREYSPLPKDLLIPVDEEEGAIPVTYVEYVQVAPDHWT